MKYIRILSIFLAVLAVLIISVPASANGIKSITYNSVNGIEIAAGKYDSASNTTVGATFTALALKTTFPFSGGVLTASVNFTGEVPGPSVKNGSNAIVGGKWSLKVTSGKDRGTIAGIIVPGSDPHKSSITWQEYRGSNTGRGYAYINLQVVGGTEDFSKIQGTGVFTGWDVHQSGLYVLGIQVPEVREGKLQLSVNY
jgi:hypothetical protein